MNVFVKEYDHKAEAIVTNAILMPAGEVRSPSFRLVSLKHLVSCLADKVSLWE